MRPALTSTTMGGRPCRRPFSTRLTTIRSNRLRSVVRSRGSSAWSGRRHFGLGPSAGRGHAPQEVEQVDLFPLHVGGAGVEPRDLQQVVDEPAEAADIAHHELRGSAGLGREVGRGVRGLRLRSSSEASPTSAATGVRNSWATSAVNRRSRASAAWRAAILACRVAVMVLNEAPSVPNSSLPAGRRTVRSPSATRTAASLASVTGRVSRRARIQPTITPSSASATPVPTSTRPRRSQDGLSIALGGRRSRPPDLPRARGCPRPARARCPVASPGR